MPHGCSTPVPWGLTSLNSHANPIEVPTAPCIPLAGKPCTLFFQILGKLKIDTSPDCSEQVIC